MGKWERAPKWLWIAVACFHVAATIYFYPEADRWLYQPNPYAPQPGFIILVGTATVWALPYSAAIAVVLWVIVMTRVGLLIRDMTGQVLSVVLVATIGFAVLTALLSPRSCSGGPDIEREYRAP